MMEKNGGEIPAAGKTSRAGVLALFCAVLLGASPAEGASFFEGGGPHKLTDYRRVKMGFYAGHKNSPREQTVEFDDIRVELMR